MKHLRLSSGQTLLAGLLLSLLSSGCHSTGPAPADPVRIIPADVAQVRATALDTFGADGFQCTHATHRRLQFEKRAGAMSDLAYGGWLDTSTWVRIKVSLEPLDPQSTQIDATAYRVADRGSGLLEDETRLRNQTVSTTLLDQIEAAFQNGR